MFISVFIDETGDSCDFLYSQGKTHSKTNRSIIDENAFCGSDVIKHPSYCGVIPEEDETKTESEDNYDEIPIFESDVSIQSDYKHHLDVILDEENTFVTETVSDLYYDVMDDSGNETSSFKTKIDNLSTKCEVDTQHPLDLLKMIDQSINVKRCQCDNSIFFPLPSLIFAVTILIINIVIFLKNTEVVWINLVNLFQSKKGHLC